jgi:copper chaperone NosL
MKSKNLTFLLGAFLLFFTVACKVEPQKIEYGKDQCNFCKMNIVDKTHSAQYVTKKGKQFKFDAIECMVNDISEKDVNDIAIFLVADYGNPGEMVDALTVTYLISKAIKSPMGANLSALSSKEKAVELQTNFEGEIFTWESLKQKLADK